jgi:hypothetical protein
MRHRAIPIAFATLAITCWAGVQYASSQTADETTIVNPANPKLVLTAAQRQAIYSAIGKDKNKVAPKQFPAVVGAEVPPMIVLYALPDSAVSDIPAAKFFEYTMLQDKVVLVDPTKMRVVDIIGPPPPKQ